MTQSVDHKSLLFDLCDNLRTPFVPRIQLLADHEDAEDDSAFGGEPNGNGVNGYLRMRLCDFIREYVGGSKPAILQVDEDLLSRIPSAKLKGDGENSDECSGYEPKKPENSPSAYPQPPQLGVFDENIEKYHWAVRWHCNEYLVQKVKNSVRNTPVGEKKEESSLLQEPEVTVALTPNGRADAITRIKHIGSNSQPHEETYFASAAEVKMPMSQFFELLAEAQQNDLDNDHEKNMTPKEEEASMGPKADYHRFVDLVARCEAIEKSKSDKGIDAGEKSKGEEEGKGITIYNPTNNTIPYIQLQNSSLSTEYSDSLYSDVPAYVKEIGQRLFGKMADAENLWIGSHLSTTTMHQDWYENLYWVVRGTKTFTLVPPWEAPYLKKRRCQSVAYVYQKEECTEQDGKVTCRYTLQPTLYKDEENVCNGEDGQTEWVSTDFIDDPAPVGAREGDTRHQCHPATASVHSGEVLYLPAMWFHAVEQAEEDEEERETGHGLENASTENGEAEEEEEVDEDGQAIAKSTRYYPKAEEDEEGKRNVSAEGQSASASRVLSSAAASAPCVIAVNYWFEMNCGGPLFWIQEMLKGMFPQKK